jgi:hypothetical protein
MEVTAPLVAGPYVPDSEDDDLIIRPGQRAPFLIPWCSSCKDTVEKYTFDVITSPVRMGVQATCHGATQGIWISTEDLFARKRGGVPIVMFKPRAFGRVR